MGVLDERAANIDSVESIERSSIDFYATTRNLYRQHRNAQINGGTDLEQLPDL
jgi:phospholipid-binding lipoprotein MlaA